MKYKLEEILNINQLEHLMQKFIDFSGVATAIIDLEGRVVLAAGWKDICTQFHRVNPDTCKRCIESDMVLANQLKTGQHFNLYKCLNGMVDVAVPIQINNEHVANLFIGQFLMEKPDISFFKAQAGEFGFNEEKYMAALSGVAVIDEEEIKEVAGYLFELASYISESGYTKYKLQEKTDNQELIIRERTEELEKSREEILNSLNETEKQKKAIEKLNRKLNKTLIELKRSNEELEQFAYVASHDLQEPLRMVSSYTQLLANKYEGKLDDKADTYIHFAVDGATRMQGLINNLLDYSRVSTRGKQFQPVDCNRILDTALTALKNRIEDAHAVVTSSELPEIYCDEDQMTRVFLNLIGNAIKFNGEKVPVISISAEPDKDFWLFKIADNGIGIDPKYNEKIFVIFQRLHSRQEYEGNGIGLSICKRIINRHGGDIWLESKPGEGTTFFFTIPKQAK